ncbi:MAG: flotillin family protein [Calditrichia bacterium]
MNFITDVLFSGGLILLILGVGVFAWLVQRYKKIDQGMAIVRNGIGGSKVSFTGMFVFPVLHRGEYLDISVKRVEIERSGKDGLICEDNIRADIKVAFFVRVNKTEEDVLKVAQSLGTSRASDQQALIDFFDAKFSEALKTVGKQFAFVDLYNSRERFKSEILQTIGTDLNGYVLDDAAIDYLEQTPLDFLSADNILDAQGIKKITDITAQQSILSNQIARNKEKTITQQDVEAREAILELNRQLAETEERQKREIASIKAREEAEAARVEHEERLKSERARILTEEELAVAEENKLRQVIVAAKSKERTDAVENERVLKDKFLEQNERERVVSLAQIEKERAIEEERKNIQEVIRERIAVEKSVVEEEERIKDTRAIAEADRKKQVALTFATQEAEEAKTREVIAADAAREAARMKAEQDVIEAEASKEAATKEGEARKTLAEAQAAEEATLGLSEVQVLEAKANAIEKQGSAEANVLEMKATAEARGIEAKAVALEKEGTAEATVMSKKFSAEAQGIEDKAAAMKKLDGVGKEHEEFKLRLDVDKQVKLAKIHVQKDIAEAQASVIREGLQAANIDIVGGESMFFDKIVGSISNGKAIDRFMENSTTVSDIKDTFFSGDADEFSNRLQTFISRFGMSSADLKNLTISALIAKLMGLSGDNEIDTSLLHQLRDFVEMKGIGSKPASSLLKRK